jgi:hypothetical protein
MMKKKAFLVSMLTGLFLIGCLGVTGSKEVNDIITMLKAQVGQQVIKEHIVRQGWSFDLTTDDIVKLKKAGASDDLLSYMLKGSDEFPFELEEGIVVDQPVVYRHLALYPVVRTTTVNIGDYITLDMAQANNCVVIKERPNASVPTVLIKNTGKRPIYIMAGEIIIGGKQDRMVSFDIIIPAGKEIEVEVRCVEHGRWHGASVEFSPGGAVGSKKVRTALQFKTQHDVWDEVANMCEEHDIASSSGTYGALLSSGDIDNKSKPFLDAMNKGLQHENMVGLIMALNGEVVCVDIFMNPAFFAQVKEKLLKAYVLDAISADETDAKPAGKQEIISFFDELSRVQRAELKGYIHNSNVELESERIIGNESRDSEGRIQHLNLYTK